MDPLTQGVVGAVGAVLVAKPKQRKAAAVLGAMAGMSPDLDVLIRSETDPLLALEYHRQFTHSLFFVPVGAAICTILLYSFLFRRWLSFQMSYVYCLAGYSTHALLDACTTYGTQLLWPFSNARIAWNNVSVVDPLFTIPLLLLLIWSLSRKSRSFAFLSVAYALSYLGLGAVQQKRAESHVQRLVESRNHQAINLGLKPSFANILVWKSVYEHEGRFYVDAVRAGLSMSIVEGTSTEKLDLRKHFTWLDSASQQAKDIDRFAWFSNYHLGIDPDNSLRIIDIRYSLIPNQLDGMWGIILDESASPSQHVEWNTTRPQGEQMATEVDRLWELINGE